MKHFSRLFVVAPLAALLLLAACSKEAPPAPPEAPAPILDGALLRYPAGHPQL